MASGNHFLTDVLVGAAIGTVCGFAVPYMHTLRMKNDNKNIIAEKPEIFKSKHEIVPPPGIDTEAKHVIITVWEVPKRERRSA